jgi:hypothetical protein
MPCVFFFFKLNLHCVDIRLTLSSGREADGPTYIRLEAENSSRRPD